MFRDFKELAEYADSLVPVGPVTPPDQPSATGEAYVDFAHKDVDPAVAVEGLSKEFEDYLRSHRGTIYWGRKPQLTQEIYGGRTIITCRLSILKSEKPMLPSPEPDPA